MTVCEVEGCGREATRNGWGCEEHWQEFLAWLKAKRETA